MPTFALSLLVLLSTSLLVPACTAGETSGTVADAGPRPDSTTQLSSSYSVLFETTAGNFNVDVTRSWSPNGSDRFGELVDAGFYDGNSFFRVVPGFVVQFGINGTPSTDAMWRNLTIADDPVVESNVRGYLSFAQTAQPNSRTTQLFVNYGDNSFLDGMGFAPFGVVTANGMSAVDSINSQYGEQPDQGEIANQGDAYIDSNFPELDKIIRATRLSD